MSASGQDRRPVRFGDFAFDPLACELRRADRRIRLQVQPSRMLELLIERAGHVVTRAELRDRIWPSTIHVDFDHGLNNAITRLRQALDDSAGDPRYIETVPRVGYRFVCPVEQAPPAVETAAPRNFRRPTIRQFGIALLALSIVGAAGIWITIPKHTASGPASGTGNVVDPAAYDAYLRGLDFYQQRSKESMARSIEHLTLATQLAPDFAPAYAALAISYAGAGGDTAIRYLNPDDAMGPGVAAVEKALDLEPDLARAHLALAVVLKSLQPRSAATDVAIEESFLRASKLDPFDADVALQYGNFLSTRDRSDEAIVQFRRGLELDSLSPSVNSRLGMELVAVGRYDEGLAYLRKTVELDPWQFNAQLRLGWVSVALDELDDAERAFTAAEQISPNSVRSLAGLAYVAARRGDEARARAILDVVLPAAAALDDTFDPAIIFVGLRDRENALLWLARTARESTILRASAPWGIRAPMYDWLRDDERFAAIEREVVAATGPGALAGDNF